MNTLLDSLFGAYAWVGEVFLVVLVTAIVHFALRLSLSRFARHLDRTKNVYDNALVDAARGPLGWAIWLIGIFYIFSLVIGYGAGALVGKEEILGAPGAVNAAAPLLAFELGGTALLGIISGVAFATILAVVAGLTITASASFAHDIYASVIKKGQASADSAAKSSYLRSKKECGAPG